MTTYLTAEDVAERLHTKPPTVRLYAARGELRGSKVGKRWLFTEDAVEEYVEGQQNQPPSTPHRRRRRAR